MYFITWSKKTVSWTKWILFVVIGLILHPDSPSVHIPTPPFSTHQATNLNFATKKITKVEQHMSDVITFRKNEFNIEISNIQWWKDQYWSNCVYVAHNTETSWKCIVLGGSGGSQIWRICGGVQKQKERRRQDATVVIIRKETLWNSIKMPKSTLLVLLLLLLLFILCKSFNVG